MRTLHSHRTLRRDALGVTLIELMVAVAIGGFLMIGAVTVFVQSRSTFRVNQTVSRLQENARFALATIEPDIRMASYYGLINLGTFITGHARTTQPNGIGPATCGNNWAIDLENPVAGTNNAYAWACAAAAGGARAGSDTIVIRRTADNPTNAALLVNQTLYVQSSRGRSGTLFVNPPAPAATGGAQNFILLSRGYYVCNRSASLGTKGNTIPSLHRKFLKGNPLGINDEEILAGVEDMQIEFGVDTDVAGQANRGSIDRYVNPNDPVLLNADTVVLAVRVWLRLRAEDIENEFRDTTNYVYADVNYTPAAAEQPFRRLLVSKTIYLRNTRPPS